MINFIPDRTNLHDRHRLSHEQVDRWLGENRSKEFFREKIDQLEMVNHFLAVTDQLNQRGIVFANIKGPLLSYLIYNDPAVRF